VPLAAISTMSTESEEDLGHKAIQEDEFAVVTCETSKGIMVWELYRFWSPAGYDRVVALMEHHFYDDSHFFRTVPGFLVQFGISYTSDATVQDLAKSRIPDDPQHDPPIPFTLGTISYAGTLFVSTEYVLCSTIKSYPVSFS
jgi:Cyclophilin type peptidyl-prolyl cis-trans isomerase/CLD